MSFVIVLFPFYFQLLYVSLQTKADSCFGSVVQGAEVVERMKKQPGGKPPNGILVPVYTHICI